MEIESIPGRWSNVDNTHTTIAPGSIRLRITLTDQVVITNLDKQWWATWALTQEFTGTDPNTTPKPSKLINHYANFSQADGGAQGGNGKLKLGTENNSTYLIASVDSLQAWSNIQPIFNLRWNDTNSPTGKSEITCTGPTLHIDPLVH